MTDNVREAEDKADAARLRLKDSYQIAKQRLNPQTIKTDLLKSAKSKLIEKTERAADVIKSRPGVASTLIAATALVLLRKPIKTLFDRLNTEKKNG